MLLLTAKNLAIVFALATTAFCVSTVVLAVQNSDLEDELQDALDKLDAMGTTVMTTSSTTASTNTPDPSAPTSNTSEGPTPTDSSTTSTASAGTPSSSESSPASSITPTTITPSTATPSTAATSTVTPVDQHPDYPTLPTGLPNVDEIVYRLPNHIRPVRYRLYWHPDIEQKTCEGTVSVQIEVDEVTNLIVMHAKDLVIENISILQMMVRMRLKIKEFYLSPERELLIIELDELIYTATPYVVSISFSCTMSGLSGLYTSSYSDEDNEQRWIATSKFEPTYARQAFPCFDEPAMKAPFDITVVRPTGDGYHALSNMNIESEDDLGEYTEVHFAETVPMSTYLACFIVSDFAHQSATVRGTVGTAPDFEMRVFSTAAQVNKVKYALDTGVAITEYYIEYFNVAYPLPKLDMAAIPDFVSGAMEHWGLVTYRETALLYDEESSSSANKQRVATVVAHELAHMWFGNLVTMKWWNDLWLNEGFASYIEYKGVDKVHPEWQMLDQFVTADLQPVMKFDATLASHAIVQTVSSPSEITELFDTITYSKGASIIRMLEDLVGEEKFRNATTKYLNSFFYSNAETDDFLTKIEEEEFEFDVKLIMQTWTQQMGLPVVNVARDGNTYTLTQKRFFSNPEDYNGTYEDSTFNYRWMIPLTYFTSADSEVQRTLFNYNDNEVSVTVPTAVDWIKFNKNQVGYYRVNYPTDMWQELTNALINTRGVFSVSDRAHLIDDVSVLADASQLPYSVALNLLSYLENELDYVPWSVGTSRLSSIKNLLYYTDLYRDFSVFARNLVSKVYQSLTWNVSVDHLQNLLRVTILNAACSFGHEEALQEAATRFEAWLVDPSVRPSADIRSTVYYYGMQAAGNETSWDKVWELFVAEQDAQEKIKLMEALAAIKEPWILQRYINLAWNESYVRGQDYFTCLQYISNNRIGESLVWDHVRENWLSLVERFGINERTLGRLIPAITNRFVTATKEEEMNAFFAKYPEAGAGTAARKQALETVKYNIKWLEENKEEVGAWLQESQNSEGTTEANNIAKN